MTIANALNTKNDVSNKTLACLENQQTFTKAQTVAPITLSNSTTTINTDATQSNLFYLTLNQNATLANPTGLVNGTEYTWIIYQPGLYTLTLDTLFEPFAAPTPLQLSSGATRITAIYDGSNLLYTWSDTLDQSEISIRNHAFVAENGQNVAGAGTLNVPYLDPFYATAQTTLATVANPVVIDVSAGLYLTASSFPLKPNVNYSGTISSIIDASGGISLDSTWSTTASGSYTIFTDVDLIGTSTLSWVGISNVCGIKIYNSLLLNSITCNGNSNTSTFMVGFGTDFQSDVIIDSCNSDFGSCEFDGILDVTSSHSTSTFLAYGCNIAGAITFSGANTNTATIRNSAVTSSITISSTSVHLTIDDASWPQGGFVFSGGASMGSNVTVIHSGGLLSSANTYSGNNTFSGNNIYSGNNTFSGNNIFTGQNGVTPAAITSSSNATAWNLNTAPNATYAAVENSTLSAPTNQTAGYDYTLKFVQNGSAAKTFAFNSAYKFPGGVVPVVSTGLNAIDIFTFRSDGTNMLCIGIAQNIS